MAFSPYLPFFVSIQTSIANFRRLNRLSKAPAQALIPHIIGPIVNLHKFYSLCGSGANGRRGPSVGACAVAYLHSQYEFAPETK
jgi:hypothetical protein